MIWIILAIIAGLAVYRFSCFSLSQNIALAVMIILVGFWLALKTGQCVDHYSLKVVQRVERRSCPLVAFNDQFSLGGSFFLGCGNTSEKTKYVFYTKDEREGIQLKEINIEVAVIYEDRVNDGLLKELWRKSKWTLWSFIPGETIYEFHIPPGTVVGNFKADLQ